MNFNGLQGQNLPFGNFFDRSETCFGDRHLIQIHCMKYFLKRI